MRDTCTDATNAGWRDNPAVIDWLFELVAD